MNRVKRGKSAAKSDMRRKAIWQRASLPLDLKYHTNRQTGEKSGTDLIVTVFYIFFCIWMRWSFNGTLTQIAKTSILKSNRTRGENISYWNRMYVHDELTWVTLNLPSACFVVMAHGTLSLSWSSNQLSTLLWLVTNVLYGSTAASL